MRLALYEGTVHTLHFLRAVMHRLTHPSRKMIDQIVGVLIATFEYLAGLIAFIAFVWLAWLSVTAFLYYGWQLIEAILT